MTTIAARFGLGSAVLAGIIGGLVFAAFEMVTAALMGDALFTPLRMIGAMVIGMEALDPSYPLVTAAIAGVIVHMVLSIAFAVVLAAVSPSTATTGTLVLLGIGFGIALWLVNFYAIAPIAGWTWFQEQTNPVVQFLAHHAFFFGAPVGWYVGSARPLAVPSTL